MGSSHGSTLQSVGLHVIATIPRSPRIGSRRRASAMDTKSIGTPAGRPRATSRASCSASRSVRAILSAPLWVKRSGWPVSSVNAASFATARWASLVSCGVARTWLESPAARGEVCDARPERSSTATRAPRRARWYATLAPNAPEPTTTASAVAIIAPSCPGPRSVDDAVAARVALGAVLVGDDTSGRGVSAQEPEHPIASDAEAVRGVGRNRERVALLEHDRLVLAAFDPRLGGAVQDVEDLDVGMRVQRRLVAGLCRLDAGADGRRALVVADDQLVVGQRAEADALRLSESNHRGLFHGETLRWRKSVTSGQARSA